MMKRILSLFLSLCFILAAFALTACGETPAETTVKTDGTTAASAATETTVSSKEESTACATVASSSAGTSSAATATSASESTSGKTKTDGLDGLSKHPDYMDVNFGGKTFRFAQEAGWSGGWATYEVTAEATGNDSLLDEAIQKRNDVVESLYNCKIQVVLSQHIPHELVAQEIQTGICSCEFIYTIWQNLSPVASYNMYALDIDLTNEWWDQSFIDAFSVTVDGKDRLYCISGQFNLMSYDSIATLWVNKGYYDQLRSTGKLNIDVFESVREGTWTIDKMTECVQVACSDTNGDQKLTYDGGDIFGLIDDKNSNSIRAFFFGCGQELSTKDESGQVISVDASNYDIGTMSDAIDKIIAIYKTDAIGLIGETDSVRAVSSGQSLFYNQYVLRLHSDDKDVVYGVDLSDTKLSVAPYPKLSESQERYYSYVTERAYGIKVNPAISNPGEVSQFMEVFAYHSMKILYPGYIKYLSTQCLCDEEAGEMLQIIFDSRSFNFCMFNTSYSGALMGKIVQFVQSGKNNITRAIAGAASTLNQMTAENAAYLRKADTTTK